MVINQDSTSEQSQYLYAVFTNACRFWCLTTAVVISFLMTSSLARICQPNDIFLVMLTNTLRRYFLSRDTLCTASWHCRQPCRTAKLCIDRFNLLEMGQYMPSRRVTANLMLYNRIPCFWQSNTCIYAIQYPAMVSNNPESIKTYQSAVTYFTFSFRAWTTFSVFEALRPIEAMT